MKIIWKIVLLALFAFFYMYLGFTYPGYPFVIGWVWLFISYVAVVFVYFSKTPKPRWIFIFYPICAIPIYFLILLTIFPI